MFINTFAGSISDINECAKSEMIQELLIECDALSRLGGNSLTTVIELAKYATRYNLSSVLIADVIVREPELPNFINTINQIPQELFSAIRVSDLGLAYWILENTKSNIHFCAEAGFHNLSGILALSEIFGQRLTRIVLSNELPLTTISKWCQAIKVPVEILGAGRIELFYTPRPLLSNNFTTNNNFFGITEVLSSSEDSHNRAFPTVESRHGTIMFLHKDRNLFSNFKELEFVKVATFRIDMRHISNAPSRCTGIGEILNSLTSDKVVNWPIASMVPFQRTNGTTRQFSKLRSFIAEGKKKKDCFAIVLDTKKDQYTALKAFKPLEISDNFIFATPEGIEKIFPVHKFYATTGEPILQCDTDDIFVAEWVRGAVAGSLLYRV
jgi:U32 family peptidase